MYKQRTGISDQMTERARQVNDELWDVVDEHRAFAQSLDSPHLRSAGKLISVFRLSYGLKLQVAPLIKSDALRVRPCYPDLRDENTLIYGRGTTEHPFMADALRIGIVGRTLGMTALTNEIGGGFREEVDIDLAQMSMQVIVDTASINQR